VFILEYPAVVEAREQLLDDTGNDEWYESSMIEFNAQVEKFTTAYFLGNYVDANGTNAITNYATAMSSLSMMAEG
jgi:hypothetical protein